MSQVPPPLPPDASPPEPVAYAYGVVPSKWPTAVGVISIIYAGLILLSTSINALGRVWPGGTTRDMMAAMPSWYVASQAATTVLQTALAVLLLVGGILLLRRRPASRGLHLAWAWGAAALTVLGFAIALWMMPVMERELQRAMPPGTGSVAAGAIATGAMWLGVIGGFVIGLVYPIFVLAWFYRGRIRQEVALWTTPLAT